MNDVEQTLPIRPDRPDPLPRRRGQAHLEPQLREPGGAGTATPFTAFAAAAADPAPGQDGPGDADAGGPQVDPGAADSDDPDAARTRRSTAGARAAAFRAAADPRRPG